MAVKKEVKADNPNYKGKKSSSGGYLSSDALKGKPNVGKATDSSHQTGTGGKPGGMIKPFGK